MPELPDDLPASTDESEAEQPGAKQPSSQSEHAEPTEQPDEEDEPQAGSPS
jgi:hypothetical protein